MEQIWQKRNNCVLVMLKELTGKSDEEIFAAVRRHNYRDNHGMYQHDYLKAATELGMKFGEIRWGHDLHRFVPTSISLNVDERFALRGKITISKFLKYIKTGTYMVRSPGHVFVVRDGKLL